MAMGNKDLTELMIECMDHGIWALAQNEKPVEAVKVGHQAMMILKTIPTPYVTVPDLSGKVPPTFRGIAIVESSIMPPNAFEFIGRGGEVLSAGTIKGDEDAE